LALNHRGHREHRGSARVPKTLSTPKTWRSRTSYEALSAGGSNLGRPKSARRSRIKPSVFPVSFVVTRLADIELCEKVETNVLESVDTAIIGRDLAHELSGTTDHFVEVLDNQVIDLLRAQERFGHSV
jgi:ATP phosphoribosyltransferase